MSGYEVLDLFSAAAGGWSLGMHRAGFRTIAACEVIDWRRALYQENNPGVRIYDDVRTLTADRLVRDLGRLPSVVVGSPPCQDISSANTKGKGVEGERSGLYFDAVRIIGEVRPRWFALENSANLRTRGADAVLAALEALGYACWAFVVGAGHVGANHERARSWIIGFDANQIADAGGWEQRQQPGRRDGPNWASPAFHGDNDPAEHDGYSHCERSASRVRSSQDEGSDAFFGRRLRSISEPRRDGAFLPHSNHQGEFLGAKHAEMGKLQAVASDAGNPPHADEAGQEAGLLESSLRPAEITDNGRCHGWGDDGQGVGQMGRSESTSHDLAEPWADWNGGLAGHLRVDDGLSPWVAGARIAVGGPKGTSAASLIVEAFGDAVVPQIPEAIGRAILRTEAALRAVYQRETA